MATYKMIQEYVKANSGFTPKTCWIAHMKELCNIPVSIAPNRNCEDMRENPCPLNKQAAIKDAFIHFKMV